MSDVNSDDDTADRAITLYEVLRVPRTATMDEIESAFRERVLEHHPDLSDRDIDEQYMDYVIKARETLLDPEKRAAYDEKLDRMDISPWREATEPEQTVAHQQPREDQISYFIDEDWLDSGHEYPDLLFDDPVSNLTLKSWVFRILAVVGVIAIFSTTDLTFGQINPLPYRFSDLFLGITLVFLGDAIRTGFRIPSLEEEVLRITEEGLPLPVIIGAIGALLGSASLHTGGQPGSAVDPLLLPFAAVLGSVGIVSLLAGMNYRYAVIHATLWAMAVSIPFGSASATFLAIEFVPSQYSLRFLVGTVLLGFTMATSTIGLLIGVPTISRWAWELHCRESITVIPHFWDWLLAVPIVTAGVTAAAGRTVTFPLVLQDPVTIMETGISLELAGLLLIWTVPIVGVVLYGRVLAGRRLRGWAA